MSGQITRNATDSQPLVRPDATGFRPTHPKQPYPDIPTDDPSFNDPGLFGGPTTESIPGTAHDLPFDLDGSRDKQVVAPVTEAGDGGEAILSSRPRETGGERPDNH